MKTIKMLIAAVTLLGTANFSPAQNINWRRLNTEQMHLINLNIGWDYGSTIGIGYGYKLRTDLPVVLNVDFSLPFGSKVLDDFKVKLGGQVELVRQGNFSATVKAYAIFRRYQNIMARLLNFGSEFSGVCGYYRPNWYAAAEFGFDKAITTHIKNSAQMREYFLEVKDGWYIPTAGNFFYGIQGGYSFNRYDVYLKIGKTVTQDLKTAAMIPFYLQLGLNSKF